MDTTNITWRGDSIDDVELLRELPPDLVALLADINGFILHSGALHVRGAALTPEWHSLRKALRGENAFCRLYDSVTDRDIPFAQDQVGDQFLLKGGRIHRLAAETGEVFPFCASLAEFLAGVTRDIEGFLNVGLEHQLEPGQLLQASPPFCVKEASKGISLRSCPATQLILFHADFARQIRDVPDGGQIEIRFE